MKRPTFPWPLPLALLLAALGQAFLIHRDLPWTLVPGLLFALLAGLAFWEALKTVPAKKERGLSPQWEALLLAIIMGYALGIRLYHGSDFPNGIFTDEACAAWGGLMIARQHFDFLGHLSDIHIATPSLAYWASLWYRFAEPSQGSFLLFSVLLSLLSFPFLYWAFRQLAGPAVALTALLILAAARWHITYSRTGHPAAEFLLYLAGALAFWMAGWRTGKKVHFIPAALFTATGLYSYQGFFAFLALPPLLWFYERRRGEWKAKAMGLPFATAYGLALLAGIPIYRYLLGTGGLGQPGEKLLYHTPEGTGFPSGLVSQFLSTVLAFNRQGDSWALHNLPFHRLLDDVTGVLWILGIALVFARRHERRYAYAGMGLFVMALPALLSTNPTGASRLMGTLPFVVFLAACALLEIVKGLGQLLWRKETPSGARAALLAAALLPMAWSNFDLYFNHQAKDPECLSVDCPAETAVGNAIQKGGSGFTYHLASRFFQQYAVMFLGYENRDRTYALDLDALPPPPTPAGGLYFILDEGKSGVLDLLERLYPREGYRGKVTGPDGRVLYLSYIVPGTNAWVVPAPKAPSLPKEMGLRGEYRTLDGVGVHRDLLLNFTFHNDFPFRHFPPLSVSWTGWLEVPRTGTYRFLALKSGEARLELNGALMDLTGSRKRKLTKGRHRLQVLLDQPRGTDAAFTLLWRKPGSDHYEVMPPSAYRMP